mmetsp:Transcript_13625/g.34712  ORF Transcript_13625/g.34712 Transcript_13625/m.34712 type:complete len:253 (-) Transcript_13625:446-1204(-)
MCEQFGHALLQLGHKGALIFVYRQHPADQLAHLLGVEVRLGELQTGDHAQVAAVAHTRLVVFSDDALEGREVEAHRVEAAPQRPHVRPFVDLRVAGRVPQLRRAVRHRTVLRCVLLQQQGLCARVDLDSRKFGGAEVHEHRHISRAEQHVRRLDVAVCPDGCVCVELLQSSQNPREDAQRLYLGQVLAALEQQADSIVQRASVERHEQPELSRLVLRRDEAVVDERHQVGVREGIVHTYFPFGGLHRVRVCC